MEDKIQDFPLTQAGGQKEKNVRSRVRNERAERLVNARDAGG